MVISSARRAERSWRLIQRNPLQVAFKVPRRVSATGVVTPEQTLDPQTVRLESDNRASLLRGQAGSAPIRIVIIYGVKDHPEVPDTDMHEGYTFSWEDDTYTCVDVLSIPGGYQGIFEVVG